MVSSIGFFQDFELVVCEAVAAVDLQVARDRRRNADDDECAHADREIGKRKDPQLCAVLAVQETAMAPVDRCIRRREGNAAAPQRDSFMRRSVSVSSVTASGSSAGEKVASQRTSGVTRKKFVVWSRV